MTLYFMSNQNTIVTLPGSRTMTVGYIMLMCDLFGMFLI